MARRNRSGEHHVDLAALVETTRGLPAFSFAGFDPSTDPPRTDVMDLPFDPRSPAAGLFGMRARRTWAAVAVTVAGTARHIDDGDALGEALVGVVVARRGGMASFVDIDESAGTPVDTTRRPRGPELDGLLVDSLHRVLGLPSPGEPPDPSEMMTSLWLDDVLTVLTIDRRITWAQMVRIHPAVENMLRSPSMTPPSDEMIIEAIDRSRSHVSWERIHRRAVENGGPTARLSAEEIRWMDPTMFARWTLSLLPTVAMVAVGLRDLGCDYEAERLLALDERVRGLPRPVSGAA